MSDSILDLKRKLLHITGLPIEEQRIFLRGSKLANDHRIGSLSKSYNLKFFLVKKPIISDAVADQLAEAEASFNNHLINGDHVLARMTAQSIIDSRRYTTVQKDRARSWLARIPG